MSNKRRASTLPLILVGLGLILIIGAGGSYLQFANRPSVTSPPQSLVEENALNVPRIGVKDAKAAFDLGSAVFVDVRDAGAFTRSRVSGSISIPLEELPQRLEELDPADWIITYCT